MAAPYRPDIDGLRAVAIVPVVLYHLDVPFFGGGFVGVDIFYVISGYLITQIIAEEIERTGSFSFANFYERRVRRIIPPLAVMMAATAAVAVVLLLPVALENFGKSVIAASFFSANFFFWSSAGYFGPAADRLPLLHTWSLAVEEQFYILFPPFLLFVWRRWQRAVVPLLAAGAVLSFAMNAVFAARYQQYVFYLAPFRAWELALGALIALGLFPALQNAAARTVFGTCGLVMIVGSIVAYSSQMIYPGVAALLPCLGAALLIYAGQSGPSPVGALLSLRVPVFVGLISYSLYLWHWPLIVFAKYVSFDGLPPALRVVLVAAAAALAILSWRYLEMPIRRRVVLTSRTTLFAAAASVTTALIAFGAFCKWDAGLPWRIPAEVLVLDRAGHDPNFDDLRCHDMMAGPIRADRLCSIGEISASASWMVWGDSEAWAMRPAIELWLRKNHEAGFISSRGGCVPLLGVSRPRWEPCLEPNEATFEFIDRHHISKVLFVAAWHGYLGIDLTAEGSPDPSPATTLAVLDKGVDATFAALARRGVQVYVFDSLPGAKANVPDTLARARFFHRSVDITVSYDEHRRKTAFFDRAFERNARFIAGRIKPADTLCSAGSCQVLSADGAPLYSDANHPSSSAAPFFATILENGYRPAGQP